MTTTTSFEDDRALRNARPLIVACIPAYNEEKNIASVIIRAKSQVHQVIVCDDGSQDMTGEIARQLGATVISHKTNMGKGVAMNDAFKAASSIEADVVVTLDGDGQHSPEEIPLLLEPILSDKAEIVNGCRLSSEKMPFYRRVGNALLNRATSKSIRDSQSGMRAYRADVLPKLAISVSGMGVDSQIITLAEQNRFRIAEVEVSTVYHDQSSTHNPIRHAIDVLVSVLGGTIERSPLRYLSFPGAAFSSLGLVLITIVVEELVKSRYFSLPMAITGLTSEIFGIVLLSSGLILHAINRAIRRLQ